MLLTGEYAVLDGAPAVTVAVGGPAIASVQPAAAWQLCTRPGAEWLAFAPQLPDRLLWRGETTAQQTALPEAVFVECLRRWPDELLGQSLQIRLDTAAFVKAVAGAPHKLGLGSSAALVVAMVAALLGACGARAGPAELRTACLRAHRAFQQGRGSGVDVLTAIHGGLLVCTPDRDDPHAEVLQWPANLHLVLVWTGRSASTPALIARYDEFRTRRASVFQRETERLRDAARQAATAWRSGELTSVLDATANYARCLRLVDEAGAVGIWTQEHRRYAEVAEQSGAVYKSAGAGGGDLGFALTDSAEVAERFRAALSRAGACALDLRPGEPGLEVRG